MKGPTVAVEVIIALQERQTLRRVELPAGGTVADAVSASGLTELPAAVRFGIYGKAVPAGTVLRNGDRVEVYRPLRADPKDLRRLRAAKRREKR
jgi:putative ubiquitin-RnfH superfamily antitoxin RatB of RatAB toxin-antitoxin module